MKQRPIKRTEADTFEIVRVVGLTLSNVEAATKYDGSPVVLRQNSFTFSFNNLGNGM